MVIAIKHLSSEKSSFPSCAPLQSQFLVSSPIYSDLKNLQFMPNCILLSVVYPSLESDEDDPALKSLPKKKKCTDDAPWSPKGNHPSSVTDGVYLM